MTEGSRQSIHFTNFVLPVEGMGGGDYENRSEPKIGNFGEQTPQYQAMFASYVKQLETHLREKGWLKMAYIYWFDEPEPKDYAFVQAGIDRLKKYAPGLQTMHHQARIAEGLERHDRHLVPVDSVLQPRRRPRASGARRTILVVRLLRSARPPTARCSSTIRPPSCASGCGRLGSGTSWVPSIWESTYWTSRDDLRPKPYQDPMSYVGGTRPEEKKYWGNGDGRFLYPPLAAATPGLSGDGPVDRAARLQHPLGNAPRRDRGLRVPLAAPRLDRQEARLAHGGAGEDIRVASGSAANPLPAT